MKCKGCVKGMNSRASFEVDKISNEVNVPERLMNAMKPGVCDWYSLGEKNALGPVWWP